MAEEYDLEDELAGEEFDFDDETLEESFDFEDEFDRLRQKTARTSAVYDELDLDDEDYVEEGAGMLAQISPGQRLILVALLLVDIVVIALGAMVVMGII